MPWDARSAGTRALLDALPAPDRAAPLERGARARRASATRTSARTRSPTCARRAVERLLCLARRADHDPSGSPLAALGCAALEPSRRRRDVAAGERVLPADGPAFHVWRLDDERGRMADVDVQRGRQGLRQRRPRRASTSRSTSTTASSSCSSARPGCGKTTALRMVAGLEDISGGTLSIGGRVVNDLTPKERDIAMVFQNYALYPHLTVAENIAFGLRLRKEPKSGDQRARGVGGEDARPHAVPRPPAEGALRRPAPARRDGPRDRAPAAGRSSWTSRSRTSTRSCASRCAPTSRSSSATSSTTTIYVTHDQVEAMTMGDRVAVMSHGRAAAGRHAAAALRPARQPLRRRLHRHAADEPARGGRDRRERHGVASRSPASACSSPTRRCSATRACAATPAGKVVRRRARRATSIPRATGPSCRRSTARLELVEALGSESMAYFRVDALAIRARGGDEDDELEPRTDGRGRDRGRGRTSSRRSRRERARPRARRRGPARRRHREAARLRRGDG